MLDFRGYLFPNWFEPLSIPKFQICPEGMKGTIPWAMYTKSKLNHSETWTKISIPLLVRTFNPPSSLPFRRSFSRRAWSTGVDDPHKSGAKFAGDLPSKTRFQSPPGLVHFFVEKTLWTSFCDYYPGWVYKSKVLPLKENRKKLQTKTRPLSFNICLLVEGGLADSTRISVPRGDLENVGPASMVTFPKGHVFLSATKTWMGIIKTSCLHVFFRISAVNRP